MSEMPSAEREAEPPSRREGKISSDGGGTVAPAHEHGASSTTNPGEKR
jgi:hypothetical protein